MNYVYEVFSKPWALCSWWWLVKHAMCKLKFPDTKMSHNVQCNSVMQKYLVPSPAPSYATATTLIQKYLFLPSAIVTSRVLGLGRALVLRLCRLEMLLVLLPSTCLGFCFRLSRGATCLARWDMLCTHVSVIGHHGWQKIFRVTKTSCKVNTKSGLLSSKLVKWWPMSDNGSLLGDTEVLSGVPERPAWLTSIRDMDTDIPGDLCRDPGVMTPLRSARDITMVGTRSVLLRWAVAPGDKMLSSPAHGYRVITWWCHHAAHRVDKT